MPVKKLTTLLKEAATPQKNLLVVLQDGTYQGLSDAEVVMMPQGWDDFKVDDELVEQRFSLTNPNDLRALASLLEGGA